MMNNSPLITVYITNHNYGKYIDQAIKSILEQSFQDFELIIIDDGSTDNSKSIIEKYEDYSNIKVVYQNNKGLTVSNNIALNLAQGEFIVRLDADDYFTKDALKLMVREFENEQLGMVFGDWYLVADNGEVLGVEQRHDFQKNVTLYDQPAHGACTMFRKSCLKQLGGYDETITRQDGYELWLRFIDRFEVGNINVPLFYYRQHSKSLTKDEVKLLDTRSNILKKHADKINRSKKIKVLGIISVRGSEIDPRSKPFVKIGGEYLIDRTISVLAQCSAIEKIVVTTPDKNILQHVNKHYDNNKVIGLERPYELARINKSDQDTIDHALKYGVKNEQFDYYFGSSIETPFKRKELIESGINIATIFDVDTVIGVRHNNKKHFRHNGKGLVPIDENPEFLRLEGSQLFTRVSGYLLREIKSYKKNGKAMGEKIGHIMMDRKAMFEIEDDMDIEIAKLIEKNYRTKY
jgi:glycosyltransferase involved in cell wall biosynthesis